jgi:FtsH-binding integral membrane protein
MTEAVSARANLALGLGLAALAAWVAGAATDSEGPIWIVMAVFALAALVVGMSAQEGRPTGRALAATIIGALGVTVFLAFLVADAVS